MDATPVLESIARLLPSLPDESIEDQLVTFDVLVGVSGPEHRPAAAELLRAAAESSQTPFRRERLARAANAVAEGQPCAFTPDGLSAEQAAAAQTVRAEDWIEPPPPPVENSADQSEDNGEEDDDDDDEDSDYMEQAPPILPHLPVRHFFPGLVVRVAQHFVDAQGRVLCSGEMLTLLGCEKLEGGGFLLNLLVRTARLTATADYQAIIENAGNAWFQPVPSIACLLELWESIDLALSDAEDEDETDSEDERLMKILGEVEACEAWLSRPGKRGPAPECHGAPLAAKVFGRDHHLTAWIRLLFAGVAVALPKA